MSTKKNKNSYKNKSNKNTKSNTNPYYFYNQNFTDTKLIPSTAITTYMKNNFHDFRTAYDKLNMETERHKFTDPNTYFNFDKMKRTEKRQFEYESAIERNPNMSLNELIAHSFFVGSPSIFTDNNNTYLKNLKFQMGKDIRRANRNINGIHYDEAYRAEYFDMDKNNYIVTDIFYKLLISFFQANGGKIDYDEINKYCLLSCQNMFNFIGQIVILQVKDIIYPEDNAQLGPNRSEHIIIKPNNKTMTFSFKTELIISRDRENGQFMDPEYPCGNLEYNLLLDLTNNTYKFTKFKLDYQLDKCGPSLDTSYMDTNSISNDGTSNDDSAIDLKYAIPVALGVGTLSALPFILGGKKKTRKRKSRNRKKITKNKQKSTVKRK
jgi:hypothetical protein